VNAEVPCGPERAKTNVSSTRTEARGAQQRRGFPPARYTPARAAPRMPHRAPDPCTAFGTAFPRACVSFSAVRVVPLSRCALSRCSLFGCPAVRLLSSSNRLHLIFPAPTNG
jgi:hypothetical protein